MSNKTFSIEHSFSLLAGVGRRESDSEAMAISANDAVHLKKALLEFRLFDEKKIDMLVNEEASRAGIIERLDALKEKTMQKPADMVLIFFSGHGYTRDDKYYLVCHDTISNDIPGTAIEGAVFVEKLKAINCSKMLVLLDCCHAEGMTDIPFDEGSFLAFKNRVIITACAKSQVSYLSRPVSIFTYAVIEALGGKFLHEDDTEVNVFNLAMDVRERVVALSSGVSRNGKPQQPQLNVLKDSGTTDFSLAYYPKGGPQELKIFKEEWSGLKTEDGKGELDVNVRSEADNSYRNQFTWMITNNSIQNIGNENVIIQGVTININSPQDDLQRLGVETIKSILTQISNRRGDAIKAFQEKLETVSASKEREKKIYEDSLNDLLEKLNDFVKDSNMTSNTATKFELKKQIERTNKEIEEVKRKIAGLS